MSRERDHHNLELAVTAKTDTRSHGSLHYRSILSASESGQAVPGLHGSYDRYIM